MKAWETKAQICRDVLEASIQKKWLAPADKVPSAEQLNVVDFPRKSGVMTEKELDITDLSATQLVKQMERDELTAEEVVVAFLKRSTLGHQVVSEFSA